MKEIKGIEIVSEAQQSSNEDTDVNYSHCAESEPYALQVTDNSMEPEFPEKCIIIIESVTQCLHEVYATVEYDGELWFRQFCKEGDRAYLRPLNPDYPIIELVRNYYIKGVITQRNVRRNIKHFDPYHSVEKDIMN
ncbi:MAG: S24 family peptidase [Methylococcales bacterium]|mgnify:CR=1 FL=1|jgi:SOS-response transcriptional repressor LexA|nr:S24 family peptidase [Methylococcales bacterium]MBT7409739.1 S24 family peptidase [Methylococcales bacterium]